MTTTQNLIQGFIERELMNDAGHRLAPDDELLLDGVLDSLGVMRLVEFIESETGVRIPPQDVTLENFHSISAIAGYLQRHDGVTQP